MERVSQISRKTTETNIKVKVNLDGEGNSNINTGIGFFDHMLTLMSKHGMIDLDVEAEGDLKVDSHHTIEDIGIVIGNCLKDALKNKEGIARYSTQFLPMDESLATVSVDISGRAFLVYECELTVDKIGDMDSEMVEEFFRALAFNAGLTLHVRVLYGKNNHHKVEAMFKALGRALREATTIDNKIKGVMSTKGVI